MKIYNLAKARVFGSCDYPNISGTVSFTDVPFGVWVSAEIKRLPKNENGFFGFHLHEGTSCEQGEKPYFNKTLAHYNPKDKIHPLHAGDFPNLFATENGYSKIFFLTDRFRVNDVIGKTVVVHLNSDDYTTQPSGGISEKIACGKIAPVFRLL